MELTTTEGAEAKVVVLLSPALSMDVTVAYRIEGHETADYDPAEPADYGAPPGVVTIEAGNMTAAIVIDINDDEEVEPTREAFKVVLEAPPSAPYTLASPEQTTAIVVIKEGVCDRTPQVRDAILEDIDGVSDCAEVTDDDLSGVTVALQLSRAGIATLKVGDFSGLGNLGQLFLDGNQLSTLPATVFSDLGSLELLWLYNNQLSTLPATVFSDLGNLKWLILYNNQLSTLPMGVFSGLGKLERLELHDNPLTILPAGIFVGLTLSRLTLPPSIAELPLRFVPVDESGEPASARVKVGLVQGAPFDVSVDLFTVNATLSINSVSINSVLIPQGATQSEVFTVEQESPDEAVVVGFAGGTSDAPPNSGVEFNISDVFVIEDIGHSVVWIPSNLLGGVASAREGETAMITVRAAPAPSEALTIGYGIDADGDDATADADGNDYTDATGGTVTIEAGEESATIEVRITDDEEIEALREFFKVFLTVPPEGAVYVLASPDQTTAIVAIKEGVCDRTPQVRGEILSEIRGVSDCADVTGDDLSGITGTLDPRDINIATLRGGDFSGLVNVEQLYLDSNPLSTLPATVFSGLGNLEELWLYNNQLSILPATVFSGLGNLRELNLRGNQLTTLPAGVFSDLGNLENLELSSNRLTTLPADVFSDLSNLENLELSSNRLTTLPADVFSGLGNLGGWGLYLQGNQLTALPAGVFSGLGNLEQLDLRENPGAPFVFARPRLEPTDTLPGPGAVEVKLVVDEPLPTTMTAGLSAEGGTLSDSQAVIPEGRTESAVFTVTQEASAPVTLRASTGTLTDFLGVETAPSELVLDVVRPSMSDVAIISRPVFGNAYRVAGNEVIRVAVVFDEAVEVSNPIAGPSLTLMIGETPRAATYAPDLSDVSTLVFTYALQAGDVDDDGISVGGDALVLAGAEITDLLGNPIESASLGSHAISNAAGHQVILTFRLRFGPSEVILAPGTSTEVPLTLEGAEALGSEEEVSVELSASPGLELLTPSPVTMNSEASSRVTVRLKLLETAGVNEQLTASASLPDVEFIPGVLEGIRLRTFRMFFEPPPVKVVANSTLALSLSLTGADDLLFDEEVLVFLGVPEGSGLSLSMSQVSFRSGSMLVRVILSASADAEASTVTASVRGTLPVGIDVDPVEVEAAVSVLSRELRLSFTTQLDPLGAGESGYVVKSGLTRGLELELEDAGLLTEGESVTVSFEARLVGQLTHNLRVSPSAVAMSATTPRVSLELSAERRTGRLTLRAYASAVPDNATVSDGTVLARIQSRVYRLNLVPNDFVVGTASMATLSLEGDDPLLDGQSVEVSLSVVEAGVSVFPSEVAFDSNLTSVDVEIDVPSSVVAGGSNLAIAVGDPEAALAWGVHIICFLEKEWRLRVLALPAWATSVCRFRVFSVCCSWTH